MPHVIIISDSGEKSNGSSTATTSPDWKITIISSLIHIKITDYNVAQHEVRPQKLHKLLFCKNTLRGEYLTFGI